MLRYGTMKSHLSIALLTLLVLVCTLFLPHTIETREGLRGALFGAPVSFVSQDLSAYEVSLPRAYSFQSPWENPTGILWARLFMSFVVIFFALELLSAILFRAKEPGRTV
jgi:hypothetical protein